MTMPRHDTPLDLEPPAIVGGRYAVDREIGRGGTAIVFLARDVHTSRHVALKVLKPEFAGSITTRRFLNEIALTTGLQHPHILSIQDSGEVHGIPGLDGLPFHVSPFMEGESLRARLERERQLPLDDAIRIATEVADALEYAHAHGVLHRDVKPENILLSGRHACVADFGIARAVARAAGDRLTTTGVTVGTPAYMSPEQASGERELDARTDVYSLACVVYEMIAGVPPFVAPTPQAVIAQRFTHPPRPLEVYRPHVPPHVEAAIARAMAILPADRTPSAQALADGLAGAGIAGAGIASASMGGASMGGATSGAITAGAMPYGAMPYGAMPRGTGTGRGGAVDTQDTRGAGPGTVARKRWTVAAVAALAVAGALYLGDDVGRAVRHALGPAPDSARYVVLPFTGGGGRVLGPDVAREQLHEALGRWRDLELVSLDAVDRETPAGATQLDDRLAVARALGAGRAVSVQLSRVADSVQLRATLYDGRGVALGERVVRVADVAGAHDGYRRLATALLRVAPPPVDTDEGDLGTDLLGAWRAYARGQE
ncbi:MAG TPA: serine/threonine-protein kinase, partial [Gemmatimonadaceae bacterium]|nr:serine/threonine-protein kinase [Gemmatimonadaceae bacterium]